MEIWFADKDIEALYCEEKGAEHYPSEVVDAFFRRMSIICSASDVRDLRNIKSAHFEKLKGMAELYSMRLNRQWRLLLTFDSSLGGDKIVVIIEISNHYGD